MQRRDVLMAAASMSIMFAAQTRAALATGATAAEKSPHILVLWRDGQQGQRLELRGRVAGAAHKPLQGALVSVRHSGTDGGYTGQYEGEMTTNARGEYILRTALPGSYGRALHIHVVVSHPSAGSEFTEIVFRGDKTLDHESQQHGIVLETVRLNDVEVLVGNFDIVLGRQ